MAGEGVLATRFSVDELRYLAGLKTEIAPPHDGMFCGPAIRGWMQFRRGENWWQIFRPCVDGGCDFAVHVQADTDLIYYRHGDMLAKTTVEDHCRLKTYESLKAWLATIHGTNLPYVHWSVS